VTPAVVLLELLASAILLGMGFWQGWTLGHRHGRDDERSQVRAWLLGSHRVEERLSPKELELAVREGEHLTWHLR
jgi:hypothetical protein